MTETLQSIRRQFPDLRSATRFFPRPMQHLQHQVSPNAAPVLVHNRKQNNGILAHLLSEAGMLLLCVQNPRPPESCIRTCRDCLLNPAFQCRCRMRSNGRAECAAAALSGGPRSCECSPAASKASLEGRGRHCLCVTCKRKLECGVEIAAELHPALYKLPLVQCCISVTVHADSFSDGMLHPVARCHSDYPYRNDMIPNK